MMAPDSTTLAIRVHPRSSKNRHTWADGDLHIWVTAPAVEGAANRAVIRYLADVLDIPASRSSIVSDETARMKRIHVPLPESTVAGKLAGTSS